MGAVQEAVAIVEEAAEPGSNQMEAIRPEKAALALAGMADGKSQRQLAQELGVGRNTLRRLEKDNKEWVGEWRRLSLCSVADQADRSARLANARMDMMDPSKAEGSTEEELEADRLAREDELRGTSLKDLTVVQAVLIDKFERLAGAPDVRVEVTHKPGVETIRAALEEARSGCVIDAEEVDS